MLQDIENGTLENAYKNIAPNDKDTVLCFNENGILIRRNGDDTLTLPEKGELGQTDVLRYAFKMQGKNYFLCHYSQKPEGYEYVPVKQLRQLTSKEICFAAHTGWHLYNWYRNSTFCGRCGGRTVHDEKERMMRCPECGNMIFPRISPAVIVCVTNGDKLLLSKYAGRNYTRYALIAGYTEIGETLEETVQREVMEEVGLKVKNIRYYKSQPWGSDGNVLAGFYCDLDGSDNIRLDETELSFAGWHERNAIPAQDDGISLTREMIRVFAAGEQPK